MTDSGAKTIIIQPICRLCKHPRSEHKARGCIHNAKDGYCGCQNFIPDSRIPSPTDTSTAGKCFFCGHLLSMHVPEEGCECIKDGDRCLCFAYDLYYKYHLSPTIETLEAIANEQGITIYSIFRRNAGWAINWHEPERQEKELLWFGRIPLLSHLR